MGRGSTDDSFEVPERIAPDTIDLTPRRHQINLVVIPDDGEGEGYDPDWLCRKMEDSFDLRHFDEMGDIDMTVTEIQGGGNTWIEVEVVDADGNENIDALVAWLKEKGANYGVYRVELVP